MFRIVVRDVGSCFVHNRISGGGRVYESIESVNARTSGPVHTTNPKNQSERMRTVDPNPIWKIDISRLGGSPG